jgi:Tfp pilus assembly protein PilO
MDKHKQWVALTLVGVLALFAAGWFLLISPKRAESADLRIQTQSRVTANAQLMSQITMLKAQAKDLPRQQARLAAVAAKIPDNPALPALIRALTTAAAQAGVELVSLSPTPPTAVAATPAPGAAAATPTAAGAAAPVGSAAGTLQSIGLTMNAVGGYFQIEQFLDRAENLTRAFKVTTFNLVPGTSPVKPAGSTAGSDPGKVLSATITGTVYMASGRVASAATVAGK